MNCGRSSSVEWKLPKLQRRVRFPSPALVTDHKVVPLWSVLASGRESKWAHCAAVWHWGSRRPLQKDVTLDTKVSGPAGKCPGWRFCCSGAISGCSGWVCGAVKRLPTGADQSLGGVPQRLARSLEAGSIKKYGPASKGIEQASKGTTVNVSSPPQTRKGHVHT